MPLYSAGLLLMQHPEYLLHSKRWQMPLHTLSENGNSYEAATRARVRERERERKCAVVLFIVQFHRHLQSAK